MGKFFADEIGGLAVEYTIEAVPIAGAIILALTALGTNLNEAYTTMAGKVRSLAGH